MRFLPKTCLLLLICAMPVRFALAASDWPEIELPPQARGQSVADDMKYNGVPMRIRQFSSEAGVEGVLAFYRQRWSNDGKLKPVQNSLGEWKIIGRQSGDYYQTVQVKPRAGGSEGFAGVTKLPSMTAPPSVDTQFPRMPETQVISDIDSNDHGKAAKTLILKNEHSVASNASYYQSILSTQDWKQNRAFGAAQNTSANHVLYFERRKEAANITISSIPQGGSIVVINIATSGL